MRTRIRGVCGAGAWLAATLLGATSVLAQQAPAAGVAQEKVDLAVVQRIRDEGLTRSQIPQLAHYLTDVIGPRMTGSRAIHRANQWTAAKLKEWGATNVVVEPWGEFGRGWERVAFSARMVEPFVQPLNAQPLAWTGSTKGTVAGPAVIVKAPNAAAVTKDYHGKLKGAFVLLGNPASPQPEWRAPASRYAADSLLVQLPARKGPSMTFEQMWAMYMPMIKAQSDLAAAIQAEGAVAILKPSSRAYGVLEVDADYLGMDPKRPISLPVVVVGQEQYGTMWRDADGGEPVKVELNVQNKFYSDTTQGMNTLGDIAGSDKADELVMLGGHLDSWHTGTGATDDAAGAVVMMEAMRILRALDLHPRRTIRIGLWDGEEQGLLGSRGWVAKHPELLPKISAYVNVDNGSGKLRGIWDQSNQAVVPIFEQILWPFRDLGVVAVRHGDTSGTDHLSFDAAGVPAFNFIQDPIDYGSRTHHTDVDTYERLQIGDLQQAAVVVAATVWELANRDEMMPRKTEAKAAPAR